MSDVDRIKALPVLEAAVCSLRAVRVGNDIVTAGSAPEVMAALIETLPARLRAARTARRLNLRETASRTGVSFNTLSRIERGVGSPTVSNAIAVMRWLDPQTAADMSGDTRGVGG